MRRSLLAALSLLALPATSLAQDDILAITSTTQYIASQTMDGQNCLTRPCVISLEKAVAGNAGGTAYDARSGVVWVTNGTALAAYIAPDGLSKACKQPCAVMKIPQPIPTAPTYCTGLAFMDSGAATGAKPGPYGRLYFSYANNYIGYADVKGCSLGNYQSCSIANSIGTANITGGLACDELSRHLFVGTFQSGVAIVYMFDADKFCSVICRFQVTINRQNCANPAPLGALTGLAFNGCTKMLYVTDGKQTIWGLVSMTASGQCSFTHRLCCPVTLEAYTGLAIRPPAANRAGKPCSSKVCNACTPTVSTTGDAVLGNGLFAVNLAGGPSNTTVYALAIGIGGCSPTGVGIGFCQPARVSLAAPGPFVLIFGATPGTGTCNRTASVPLPLPLDPKACGLTVSFQWVMECKGNPIGTAMTDCLSVQLTSI